MAMSETNMNMTKRKKKQKENEILIYNIIMHIDVLNATIYLFENRDKYVNTVDLKSINENGAETLHDSINIEGRVICGIEYDALGIKKCKELNCEGYDESLKKCFNYDPGYVLNYYIGKIFGVDKILLPIPDDGSCLFYAIIESLRRDHKINIDLHINTN